MILFIKIYLKTIKFKTIHATDWKEISLSAKNKFQKV